MSLSNISFERTAGALMPVFSLPGPYGIGVLGKEARKFADLLKSSGLHCWQVLPMVQAGAGNSPYSGVSAFAGDPLYIDPETLYEKALITREELEDARYPLSSFSVDYKWLSEHKPALLQKAFSRLTVAMKMEINRFVEENQYWIYDYALYMTMLDKGKQIESKSLLTTEEEKELVSDELFSYYCFIQHEFYSQWHSLKQYCNALGIGLIGDLPFYVSYDSSDVWANPHLFLLNKEYRPIGLAGTPPDYFSEDGQCWGNPLYDWKTMKGEEFDWWIHRIAFHLKYNDALRIDHFRGFQSYYHISAETRDAKLGRWEKGPGLDLFYAFEKKYGAAPIIAEDLGTVDDTLYTFLKQSGFPGMKVMHFAFDGDPHNLHLPHNYTKNTVAYTGTHDNNTTLGWIWESTEQERQLAMSYCQIPQYEWGSGGSQSPACRGLLRTLYQSVSSIAIAPVQDYCGFGADTRTNIPGKPEGNWSFRFTMENLNNIDSSFLKSLSQLYGRSQTFECKKK